MIRPMKAASVSRLNLRLSSFVVRNRMGPLPFAGLNPSTSRVDLDCMYSKMSLPISMTVQSTNSSIMLCTRYSEPMSTVSIQRKLGDCTVF